MTRSHRDWRVNIYQQLSSHANLRRAAPLGQREHGAQRIGRMGSWVHGFRSGCLHWTDTRCELFGSSVASPLYEAQYLEDNELVRCYARDQLLACGYVVLEAHDGTQALEILEHDARRGDTLGS